MVTITCCSQAVADAELADAQRQAYREFHEHVAGLCEASGIERSAAAESIAIADGIAIQALFDEASWPPDRQLSMLHAMCERAWH